MALSISTTNSNSILYCSPGHQVAVSVYRQTSKKICRWKNASKSICLGLELTRAKGTHYFHSHVGRWANTMSEFHKPSMIFSLTFTLWLAKFGTWSSISTMGLWSNHAKNSPHYHPQFFFGVHQPKPCKPLNQAFPRKRDQLELLGLGSLVT